MPLTRWTFRGLRLLLAAAVLLGAGVVWRAALTPEPAPDAAASLDEPAGPFDYLPMVRLYREQGRIGDALAIARFVESEPDLPHRTEILVEKAEIEADVASWWAKGRRAAWGFFAGDTRSIEGLGGTLVADFLVYGDLRDLAKQGYRWTRGDNVDELIVALSAVGLVSSVASYFPPATAGAAPAEGAVNLLKLLKRSGSVSEPLAKQLTRLARTARQTGNADELADAMRLFGRTLRSAPAGTLTGMVRHADDLGDVRTISRALDAAPDATVAAILAGKKPAVRGLAGVADLTADQVKKMARFGGQVVSPLPVRIVTRTAKVLHHGRLGQASEVIRQHLLAGFVTRPQLYFAATLASVVGLALLLGPRRLVRWAKSAGGGLAATMRPPGPVAGAAVARPMHAVPGG